MVCKKDVVAWFKNLKSYKRTDLMCSLLNLCLPFELRFLGTCLEDLGKRDFHELRQAENDANHPAEINSPDLQAISGHRARTKLALYVSLLYSCNYTCSKGIFRILAKNDEIENLLKTNSLTEEVLEDLLLVYTLALNHPAFSYEQKLTLEKIYERLQEEECRLYEQTSAARTNKSGFNSTPTVQEAPQIHEKPPQLQSYANCISLDEQPMLGVTSGGQCAPIPTGTPHLAVGMFCSGEHLVNLHDLSGGMRLGVVNAGPVIGWGGGGGGTLVLAEPPPSAAAAALVAGAPPGSSASSPSQSNSPSRSGSPPQPQRGPPSKGSSSPFPPPRVAAPTAPTTNADTLRDTIGKEMPAYLTSLQNYNPDQLSRMADDELREKGLPQSAIMQLRSILTKQIPPTNGIGSTIDMNLKKKVDLSDTEMFIQGLGRRFAPLESLQPVYNLGPPPPPGLMAPAPACYTCVVGAAPRHHPQPKLPQGLQHHHHHNPHHHHQQQMGPPPYPPLEQLRAFRLDPDSSFHGSNSSASDTASDHSPPDTPGPPPPPPTSAHLAGLVTLSTTGDLMCGSLTGGGGGNGNGGGSNGTGNDDRPSRDSQDERRPHNTNRPRGIGRNRNNPPGIQTLPRGRGLNPAHRRRDVGSNVTNGSSLYGGGDSGAVSGGGGAGGGAFYTTGATAGYLPHYLSATGRPGYPTAAAATAFPPGTFVRPAYSHYQQQPNGELVYQYPPPAPPPVVPPPPPQSQPPPPFAATIVSPTPPPPPPKISCYNCGSQNHVASDCPDATIEEVTKQGQYRIDFTPYPKHQQGSADCPNSTEK